MSKKLLLILLAVLFVLNIICIYIYIVYKNNTEYYIQSINPYIKGFIDLKTNIDYQVNNTPLYIDDISIKDSNGNSCKLSNLFDNSATNEIMICRISDLYCMSCNEYVTDIYNKLNNKYYLLNQTRKSLINNIKDIYNIDGNIYGTNIINIEVESLKFPYIFIINRELQITMVYIPNKDNYELDSEIINNMYNRIYK